MSPHPIGIQSPQITWFSTFFDDFCEILVIAFTKKMNTLAIRAGYED
jgi:hypothetical protein